MGGDIKLRVSAAITLIGSVGSIACIWRIIQFGLAGNPEKAKLYFVYMMIGFALAVPAAVVYYYLRNKARNSLLSNKVEMETLGRYGAGLNKEK